jgi:hypothetical protein
MMRSMEFSSHQIVNKSTHGTSSFSRCSQDLVR